MGGFSFFLSLLYFSVFFLGLSFFSQNYRRTWCSLFISLVYRIFRLLFYPFSDSGFSYRCRTQPRTLLRAQLISPRRIPQLRVRLPRWTMQLRRQEIFRHPPQIAVHFYGEQHDRRLGFYPIRLIPTTQSTAAEHTENWDDDFEVEACLRRDGGMCERRAGTLGRRGEDSKTVNPRSPSPPPPMPFFPPNNHHLSSGFFPRSPTTSVFSIPNTYSSLTSFMVPTHVRGSTLYCYPFCLLYTRNERAGG